MADAPPRYEARRMRTGQWGVFDTVTGSWVAHKYRFLRTNRAAAEDEAARLNLEEGR